MSSRIAETYSLSEDYLAKRRREEDEWADLAAAIVLQAFKDLVEVLYKLIILSDGGSCPEGGSCPDNGNRQNSGSCPEGAISPDGGSSPQQPKALRELEKRKSEILLFFKSPWYEALTAIDADSVIREAQEQARAKALKRLERQIAREIAYEQIQIEMEGFY